MRAKRPRNQTRPQHDNPHITSDRHNSCSHNRVGSCNRPFKIETKLVMVIVTAD